jgi:hypothetical protein
MKTIAHFHVSDILTLLSCVKVLNDVNSWAQHPKSDFIFESGSSFILMNNKPQAMKQHAGIFSISLKYLVKLTRLTKN